MANPFVQRLQSLSHLQISDIELLEDICARPRDVAAKSYIFPRSSDEPCFPVIIGGWAARHQILRNGGRQITRLMLPGDAYDFGASRELSSREELVTLSPCKVAYISRASIQGAIALSPSISAAVQNYGSMENSILSSLVVNIGRRDALERMAYMICELHLRLGLIEGLVEDDQFKFPLTQDDLADVLGLTPVHINRKLQELRQNDIITLRCKVMRIVDLPRLQHIADFDASRLTGNRNINSQMLVPG